MILGKIHEGEKKIKFNIDLKCSQCKVHVPGGMQTGEKYYGTASFIKEIREFKKRYLCGRCRDKHRVKLMNKR